MTYCLGIKTRSGIVAMADTRLTSGNECSTGKKMFSYNNDSRTVFLMTSGLRSVRDKTLTYFKEILESKSTQHNKLYKMVNTFAELLRQVAKEDKKYLEESGLKFNLNTIIGGQMEEDEEHKLYLLYPEGNWIEIGQESGSPFIIIGNSGFLSFDSTRVSANDVDFPLDIAIYPANSHSLIEYRLERDDVKQISEYWQGILSDGIDNIPSDWMLPILGNLGK
ncbi:MAG: peptidase [Cytophagales bacterium]